MFNITQEDWEEWKGDPTTKVFFEFLNSEAKAHREIASYGGCFPKEGDDLAIVGAEYMRRMIMAGFFENLTNITLQDILPEEESIDEDTSSRTQSSY